MDFIQCFETTYKRNKYHEQIKLSHLNRYYRENTTNYGCIINIDFKLIDEYNDKEPVLEF